MTIKSDISLENFEAWSGGKSTLDRIINEGKCGELESMLEDLYPDGMTDTELKKKKQNWKIYSLIMNLIPVMRI